MNQLQLALKLAGEIQASGSGASMDATGRADEHFRFQVHMPSAASNASDDATTSGDAEAGAGVWSVPNCPWTCVRGTARARCACSSRASAAGAYTRPLSGST